MKILFFAPHSAVWVHAFPEALVAEALRDHGHDIVYVTCGKQMTAGCVAMSAFGVSNDAPAERRAEVCRRCVDQRDLLRREFGFRGPDIASELTPEDRDEIARIVGEARPESCLAIEALSVPVGRIALYEFLLEFKKSSLSFNDDAEWRRYRASLENALFAVYAAKRIIERESPDAVVVYNALYSANHAVCRIAAAKGVPSYFMHAGGNLARRLQTLMISKGDIFDLLRQALQLWPAHRDQPIDPLVASRVTDHFIELLKGRSMFAYSSPQSGKAVDVREKFGVGPQQKVLCATLSSTDERFAAEAIEARSPVQDLLFPTQSLWVSALVEYVSVRPELFLIIRVHPREFPNKRESFKSAHAYQLERLFRDLPSNVAVNWPSDDLSLYDLAEVTDVFLNAWSSVGKEMSMLGIPVVCYSPDLLLYPADLGYVGTTKAEYFAAIEQALSDGWRYENILKVYRWCAIEFDRMLADISDAFDASEIRATRLMSRVFAKVKRIIDPYRAQRRDCRRRRHPIAASGQLARMFETQGRSLLDGAANSRPKQISAAIESQTMQNEIGRILRVMYPDEKATESRLGRWLTHLTETPRHA